MSACCKVHLSKLNLWFNVEVVVRRLSMKIDPDFEERPEVSAEEHASNALLQRIRKMRWIGMKSEAERLETVIAELNPRKACWPVAGSFVSTRRTMSPQLHPPHVRQTDVAHNNWRSKLDYDDPDQRPC
jgi:hypothetical protein